MPKPTTLHEVLDNIPNRIEGEHDMDYKPFQPSHEIARFILWCVVVAGILFALCCLGGN